MVECIEFRKPQAVYCRQNLTDIQAIIVALATSENDHSCGSSLLHPSSRLRGQIMCRSSILCSTFIEYSTIPVSGLGRDDLCCLYAQENAAVDQNLKSKF